MKDTRNSNNLNGKLPVPKTPYGQSLDSTVSNASSRSLQSRIRPFVQDDIPQVATLIKGSFDFAKKLSVRFISDALEEVLFHNPWVDKNIPSLVYQHSDGTVKGFIGASPREMMFNGEPVTLAITHNFVVESGPHSFMTGVKLYKSILEGPQDLIISGSAGDTTKYIAEKAGGTIAYAHSYYWWLPIRPFQSGLGYIGNNKFASFLSVGLKPMASVGEFLIGIMAGAPFRYHRPEADLVKLSASDLVACQNEFSVRYALRPAYSPETLQWVLDTAGKAMHLGKIEAIGVYNKKGCLAGWFIVFLNPGGKCEVLQMKARDGKEALVFENLIYHTWQEGAVELIGRLEPAFMRTVSRSWSFYRPGRMWMLLHGKRMDIITAICRGDMFLSRLEDDIWLL